MLSPKDASLFVGKEVLDIKSSILACLGDGAGFLGLIGTGHEFHPQSVSQGIRIIACRAQKPISGEKVKATFLLDPKPSLVPLCYGVMLATLPKGSSTGSLAIVGQEMKHEEFRKTVCYLGIFFFLNLLLQGTVTSCALVTVLSWQSPWRCHSVSLLEPCVYPPVYSLLHCRCTLRLFPRYWNSCIYKGAMYIF